MIVTNLLDDEQPINNKTFLEIIIGLSGLKNCQFQDLNNEALILMGFRRMSTFINSKFKAYAKEYFQPIFFMMPLNLIGELSKIVSISFRLFGNIMGGAIIILVVAFFFLRPMDSSCLTFSLEIINLKKAPILKMHEQNNCRLFC